MRVSIILVTLAGLSLVLGLPVKEEEANRRSIQFNEESHDEAEALIQDFDDLSERLKAVESELKDGLDQANEMEDDGPPMRNDWRGERPVYINEERPTEDDKRVCNVSEITRLVKQYTDMSPADVKQLVADLKFTDTSLANMVVTEYVESTDPEHEWHCFKYDNGMKYVVTHESKYESGSEIEGEGFCSCLPMVESMTDNNDAGSQLLDSSVRTMWDEWNDESDGYLNQMRMQQNDRTNQPEEEKCDPSKLKGVEIDSPGASDAAKSLAAKLESKKNLGSGIHITEYVAEKEKINDIEYEWHCFEYTSGGNDISYVVTHNGRYKSGMQIEGEGFCSCEPMFKSLTKSDLNGNPLLDDDAPVRTMWDEWNDESDRYLNQMRMQQNDRTNQPEEEKCDPSELKGEKIDSRDASDAAKSLAAKLESDKNLGSGIHITEYVSKEEKDADIEYEWHCFKYDDGMKYVVTHEGYYKSGMQIEGERFCSCMPMVNSLMASNLNGKRLLDDNAPAMTMWDEWNDESEAYAARRYPQQFRG